MSELKADSTDKKFGALGGNGFDVVAATSTGASHLKNGEDGQDAFAYAIGEGAVIAVVSDGAGSAPRSLDGSRTVCDAIVSHGLDHLSKIDGAQIEKVETWKECIQQAIEAARSTVEQHANELSELEPDGEVGEQIVDPLKLYHATIVGCVATKSGGVFFHLGDGLGAAVSDGGLDNCAMTRPENGEYANETYFFTGDDWQDHLRLEAFDQWDWVVLMSDGVMPFAVQSGQTGLEQRFIGPVVDYISKTRTNAGAEALYNTLSTDQAQAVSSDDKTLLWIGR